MTVAFQAIADIHTGQCAGYEVLARRLEGPAISTAGDIFRDCHDLAALQSLEIEVRRQAALQAQRLPDLPNRLLFCNLDWRLGDRAFAVIEAGHRALAPHARQLVTEVTAYPVGLAEPQSWINGLRRYRGMVALDRFGETARGMAFLQRCDIDYLKIPRSYITAIDRTPRQRVIMAQLVSTAHTLGLQVIAVGVETEAELQVCRELGCDLVQGYFIHKPSVDPRQAGTLFEAIEVLAREDRRRRLVDNQWIEEQLDIAPALDVDTPMPDVFSMVAADPSRTLLPVVDHDRHPLGVVREQALRNHAYSAYGKALIANRSLGITLRGFIERCPVASIYTPLDRLLALYSGDDTAEGIMITDQGRYRGFLSARSIIRALHEKTLARARDENPLTKLPGNDLINDYVGNVLFSGGEAVFVYLDFDNFKPFNDSYGFRQGDRAILLFADLLRKFCGGSGGFIGHIGGDDFFAGLTGTNLLEAEATIDLLLEKFRSDAESFYDSETRQRGSMKGLDRDGVEREFPLLSVSAVLLVVDADCQGHSIDDVSQALARYKKTAKFSKNRRVMARLADDRTA